MKHLFLEKLYHNIDFLTCTDWKKVVKYCAHSELCEIYTFKRQKVTLTKAFPDMVPAPAYCLRKVDLVWTFFCGWLFCAKVPNKYACHETIATDNDKCTMTFLSFQFFPNVFSWWVKIVKIMQWVTRVHQQAAYIGRKLMNSAHKLYTWCTIHCAPPVSRKAKLIASELHSIAPIDPRYSNRQRFIRENYCHGFTKKRKKK